MMWQAHSVAMNAKHQKRMESWMEQHDWRFHELQTLLGTSVDVERLRQVSHLNPRGARRAMQEGRMVRTAPHVLFPSS
jgi:uncharacterized protein YaeQ